VVLSQQWCVKDRSYHSRDQLVQSIQSCRNISHLADKVLHDSTPCLVELLKPYVLGPYTAVILFCQFTRYLHQSILWFLLRPYCTTNNRELSPPVVHPEREKHNAADEWWLNILICLNSWPTFSPYLHDRVCSDLTSRIPLSHSRLACSRLSGHIQPVTNYVS